MTWLDLAVLLALLALFVYLLERVMLPGKPSNVPYPAGRLPLIGDTWSTYRARHDLDRPSKWREFMRDMGPTFHSRVLFSPTMIFTANADNVRHMLVDNFDNYKRFLPQSNNLVGYRYGRHLFGNGIFMADNEAWAFQRKVAVPMFHKKHLDEMVADFVEHGHAVLDVLKNHARSGTALDVEKLFMKYTLDTFGTIAFGQSFDSLACEAHPFSQNFDYAQKMLMFFFSDISYRWRYPTEYFKSVEALNAYVYKTLAERRKEDWTHKSDLLSKFLSVRDADGQPLPDEWLRDIVLNFVIAGRDTTGLLLTWTFYELSRHPHVKERVRKELNDVLHGELPDAHSITQLPYLDIVIKEVLRLHPSVPHTGRFALKDDVLPDGTVVPAGSMIRYLQYFIHRSPAYWERPDDFWPERWLESGVIKHKYQYVPFHAGPMRCLGEFMAAKEAKTLIAMALPKYHLALDESRSVEEFFGVVMPSQAGVFMHVTECTPV